MNVLFVGNKEESALVEEAFREQGVLFKVLALEEARKGLDLLRQPYFDAVLVDLNLTGIEFFQNMKDSGIEVPVAISLTDDKGTGEESVRQGAQGYVVRSVDNYKSLPRLVVWAYVKFLLNKQGIGEAFFNKLSEDIIKSQRHWQMTVDAVTDYIFVTDGDGLIMRANLAFAERTGKHPREIIGQRAADMLGADVSGFSIGKSVVEDFVVGDRVFSIHAFPAQFDEKEVTVYIMEDVTEIKRLMEQLYHSDKLASLGLLVSEVAHEMNAPLTGIMGYTQMLNSMEFESSVKEKLDKVYRAAHKCRDFIERLRYFSRRGKGSKELEHINRIVEKALDLRTCWCGTSAVETVMEFGDAPPVYADSEQMQQVVLNLLVNAEQAIEQKGGSGRVVLSTSYDAGTGRVLVKVSDNGEGISPEILERIFDPFYTTKSPEKGTGLGLSIARSIVEEHGGVLRAESTPGGGTTFIIELKAAEKE